MPQVVGVVLASALAVLGLVEVVLEVVLALAVDEPLQILDLLESAAGRAAVSRD